MEWGIHSGRLCGAIFYCVVHYRTCKSRWQAPTRRLPGRARPACRPALCINSLAAKCSIRGHAVQVLSFHTYCIAPPAGDPALAAVILAETDIKTACTDFALWNNGEKTSKPGEGIILSVCESLCAGPGLISRFYYCHYPCFALVLASLTAKGPPSTSPASKRRQDFTFLFSPTILIAPACWSSVRAAFCL